jgi:rubrerythrin
MTVALPRSETDIILLTIAKEEEAILHSAMEGEEQAQSFFGHLAQGVDREELLALLETLRAEEEDHRARLRSLLYGLEADRPVVAKSLRSIRRMIPAAQLH